MKSTGHISVNKYYLPKKDSIYNKMKTYTILIVLSLLIIYYFSNFVKRTEKELTLINPEETQNQSKNGKVFKILNNDESFFNSSSNKSVNIPITNGESLELVKTYDDINDSYIKDEFKNKDHTSLRKINLHVNLKKFNLYLKNFIYFNQKRPRFWKNMAKTLFYSSIFILNLNGKEIEYYYNNYLNKPMEKININYKYSDDFSMKDNGFCSKLDRGKVFMKLKKTGSRCLVFKNLKIVNHKEKSNVLLKFFLYKRQHKTNKILLNHKKIIKFNYPFNEEEVIKEGYRTFTDINSKGTYFRVCNLFSESDFLKYGTTNIMIKFKLTEGNKSNICFDKILQVSLD